MTLRGWYMDCAPAFQAGETGLNPVPRSIERGCGETGKHKALKMPAAAGSTPAIRTIGRSSNGRTPDFDSVNLGSTPSLPAKKEIKL